MNSESYPSRRLRTMLSLTIAAAVVAGCGAPDGGQAGVPGAPFGGNPTGVDPPSLSFRDGTSPGSVVVVMSSATAGAEIFYELGLDVPLTTDSARYMGPVTLVPGALYEESLATVRAIAAVGFRVSPEAVASYRVPIPPDPTPTFQPAAGAYGVAQRVVISTSVPFATIWYTLDGSVPRWGAATIYTGPILVDRPTTLRAIATLHNDVTPVATATYTF